jgi:hypothetical protein
MGFGGAAMRKLRLFLPLLLFLPIVIYGQSERLPPVDANVTSCLGLPLLAELTRTSGAAILSSYGYDLHAPWSCTRIDSPWAAGSSLLHFQKVSAQTDDATAFSVMRVAGNAYIWVIPTESGMLEAPNVESDPHNLAAFNALLGILAKAPSSLVEWNSVGKLYMVLIGHKGVVPMKSEQDSNNPCDSNGECALEFADGSHVANGPYTKWTLTFSAASRLHRCRLIEVLKEVVRPSGD